MGRQDPASLFPAALPPGSPEARIVREILRLPAAESLRDAAAVRRLFDERILALPLDGRFDAYGQVRDTVQALDGWPAGVLRPFALFETNPTLVAAATIDYCSLAPVADGEPLSRPREMIELIRDGEPRLPGAVLAGLLMLGDPRVCALAAPLRGTLQPDQAEPLARVVTGLAYRCVVEFYLDWLDEIVDRRDDAALLLRSHLTTGLFRLVSRRPTADIIDGLRPFPVIGMQGGWGERLPLSAVAAALRGRLHDLERREGSPALMAPVLRAFGLAPRAGQRPVVH